jgi:hypothetical protein
VRGRAATRCYHEGGGYAGQCESVRAVLNNRSDLSAIIEGPPERIAVYELVLHSLKFRDFSSDREKDQE